MTCAVSLDLSTGARSSSDASLEALGGIESNRIKQGWKMMWNVRGKARREEGRGEERRGEYWSRWRKRERENEEGITKVLSKDVHKGRQDDTTKPWDSISITGEWS
eukprot:754010-Hanusia_phi.AAC.1